jgi:arginyl-tRNA synthetase
MGLITMNAIAHLKIGFQQALVAAFGDDFAQTDPILVPASNPKFGDYQSNVAMSLAKPLGKAPRAIAEQLVQNLQISELCEIPSIAGPGFINLTLKPAYLEAQLAAMQTDFRLGVARVKHPKRVIVDFSAPNIAKEMHVGHLRSTIIGDSIARILEFQGHDVLRLNHVGDWGTQFGMLITYLREVAPEALTTADAIDIGDLVAFYKKAKQRFDADETFKELSRQEVVKLQSGDPVSRHAWQLLCDQSRREFQVIYDLLDIRLTERGESFYNPLLPGVVEDLANLGLLVEDQGAQCVFLEGFTNKDGSPQPLIVQKSDGGYNYDTTDLAAIRYRVQQDQAERILYLTDAGQANHFAQVFQVARRAGWLPDTVEVVHVPFGLVQGEDGKKLKTRSGETVRLRDLLDEAIERAEADLQTRVQQEAREESQEFIDQVAKVVGMSAVKYADLSQNRTSNYIFSFDKMLSLQGNTAPYMLYAYVRTQGISRKGGIDFEQLAMGRIQSESTSDLASTIPSIAEEVNDEDGFDNPQDQIKPEINLELRDAETPLIQLPPADTSTFALPFDGESILASWKLLLKTSEPILKVGLALFCLVVFVQLVQGLLEGIGSIPLVKPFLELVGIWVTIQFACQRLLFVRDRAQLFQQLQTLWQETFAPLLAELLEPPTSPPTNTLPPLLPKPSPVLATDPAISPAPLATTTLTSPITTPTADLRVSISLQEETELALAKHLLQLSDILAAVDADLLPNRLCQYLFELSQKFNQFYDRCPVLQAPEPYRTSRLALCDLTARTLKLGLSLLGIPVLERM